MVGVKGPPIGRPHVSECQQGCTRLEQDVNLLRPQGGEKPKQEPNMSETEQHDMTLPRIQPQQNAQTPQTSDVVVDDTATQPTYANFCRVTATPEEMILDFGLNPQPFATGRQSVRANQRIVLNFYTAKRLLGAIGMTIQRHEQTFGAIELDANRRARTPQPPVADADRPTPTGRPEVIRLNR